MPSSHNRAYLDYNATAPAKPCAVKEFGQFAGLPLNPSSVHDDGRKARKIVEAARSSLAKSVGAIPSEIIFTASGTESNNTVIANFENVIVSAVEHHSILKAADNKAIVVAVDANGIVNLKALEEVLQKAGTKVLVSIILANNETGVINPVAEVVLLAKKYGALVHTDASQALGKIPLDFAELGVDFMTVSSHKSGGLQGAAALIVKDGLEITQLLVGGGQESRRRAGTENVPAIAAFGAVCEQVENDLAKAIELQKWRDEFENEIKTIAPDAVIYGEKVERLPNTSNISMPGVGSETQLIAFDLDGISVSSGSACASGKVESSHVLKAMGVSLPVSENSIRISSGWNSKQEDYAKFLQTWKKIYSRKYSEQKNKFTPEGLAA